MIQIRSPIWKSRSVGIAEHKVGINGVDLEITYEDKAKKRIYPHVYSISRGDLGKYPTQTCRNVKLRIVPIMDLTVKEYR